MVEDRRNIANTSRLTRRWAAIIGLIIILGSEYILRDVFISKGTGKDNEPNSDNEILNLMAKLKLSQLPHSQSSS